jgi:hypothetical protein
MAHDRVVSLKSGELCGMSYTVRKASFLMLLCLYLYFEETFVKLMIKIPSLYPWLVMGIIVVVGDTDILNNSTLEKEPFPVYGLEIRIS